MTTESASVPTPPSSAQLSLPPIARVVVGDSTGIMGTITPSTRGGGLHMEGPDVAGLRDLLADCRFDYAYGRQWRRLTNAELLAHLPLRLRYSTHAWAEAYDAAGNPVDTSVILMSPATEGA